MKLKKKTSKGAVYTAFVAPSRPKNESVTDQRTNGRTDTRSYRVAASRLKIVVGDDRFGLVGPVDQKIAHYAVVGPLSAPY